MVHSHCFNNLVLPWKQEIIHTCLLPNRNPWKQAWKMDFEPPGLCRVVTHLFIRTGPKPNYWWKLSSSAEAAPSFMQHPKRWGWVLGLLVLSTLRQHSTSSKKCRKIIPYIQFSALGLSRNTKHSSWLGLGTAWSCHPKLCWWALAAGFSWASHPTGHHWTCVPLEQLNAWPLEN